MTVLGPASLVKTGYTFAGWNTAFDGSGTAYAVSATFSMPAGNVTLYAQWTVTTYSVTYSGNGNTTGTAPIDPTAYPTGATVTVLSAGSLLKTGYTFAGWNTAANGSGTAYAAAATFSMGAANVTLYAQWILAAGDTAPITSGTTATPHPVKVGFGDIALTATVSDVTTGNVNIQLAEYQVDGGSWFAMTADSGYNAPTESVSATLTGLTSAPGVHTVCVRGTDETGHTAGVGTGMECILVAVYDATAGFVTGGGWIMSPAGAYAADASLTGKANFGFVSKYEKGKTYPTGDTQFVFQAANFNFKSTSYEWLVISGGKAQYQGYGTINGGGNYKFIITAIDGDVGSTKKPDTFRLKVFADNQGNGVIYDNLMNAPDTADPTTTLGGGSIVVHK